MPSDPRAQVPSDKDDDYRLILGGPPPRAPVNGPRLSHRLMEERITHCARGMDSRLFDAGTLNERRDHLRRVVEAAAPDNDTELTLILMKELAYFWHVEYLRIASDQMEDDNADRSLAIALKFAKHYAQMQSELEKSQRKGVQRIVIQNNAPVAAQSMYGNIEATPQETAKVIDGASVSPKRTVRARTRPQQGQ